MNAHGACAADRVVEARDARIARHRRPAVQRSVHWLLHMEPAMQAQSFTMLLISAVYASMLPLMQHVPQSTHFVWSALHVALVD